MKQSFNKSLSVALATLLLLFSFPFTAYATDYTTNSISIEMVANDTSVKEELSITNGSVITSTKIIQGRLYYIDCTCSAYISGKRGDTISFDISLLPTSIYKTVDYIVFPMSTDIAGSDGMSGGQFSETVDLTSNSIHKEFELKRDVNNELFRFSLSFNNFTYKSGVNPNVYAKFGVKINVSVDDATKGILNTILEWLENIRDKIVELPNSIGSFITSLGNNIKGFFTDLKNNLSSWFDDVGDWFSNLGDNLREWFSNVGDWFSQLGDRISGFFVNLSNNISDYFKKLFNKLWWGNEQGEAAYQPPTFGSGLTEVLESIDTYILSLEDTQTAIDNSKTEVVGYVAQGTEIINGFLGVAPTIVIAVLVFAVALLFARKVVGR